MRLPIFALLVVLASQVPAHAENVIVLNSADASVSLIDEATQKVVDTLAVGKEPHHLMATPDNQSLIVANSVGNNLVFLDPKTGKVQRWLEGIEDPYQLGFSNDRKWFVTNGLRLDRVDIYHYDGRNFTLAKRVPLAAMPSHMNFFPPTAKLFSSRCRSRARSRQLTWRARPCSGKCQWERRRPVSGSHRVTSTC